MNLRVIFLFLLLVMLTTETHAWWRRRRRPSSVTPPSSGSKSSPAGGPLRNPNAVVCHHYRSSNQLTCKNNYQLVTCTTQPPTKETRDDRPNGPTPRGEYLIGRRYTHQTHGIDWYKLYPKKEDSSGYYDYSDKTKKGRYAMGLHPGTISLGCVTVKAPNYDDDECWQRIRNVIDSSSMYYWRIKWTFRFRGFLYVH